MRRTTASRDERGAAAVEMALVIPILVLLVFAMIDFSRAMNAELQLSQAAREGARLAAIGTPIYTTSQAQSRAAQAAPDPAFGGGAPVATTVGRMCSPTSISTDTSSVTVRFTYQPVFWPGTFHLSQTAVMRCGG